MLREAVLKRQEDQENSMNIENKHQNDNKKDAAQNETENDSSESSQDDDDALALEGEKDIGKSTFAALQMMRQRGMLREDTNNVFAGRNNDQKLHQKSEKAGAPQEDDGLKLEYRDKTGRLMTKKQAFRYMCWTFHDKKPSKIKQAKMAQKLKAQEQVNLT